MSAFEEDLTAYVDGELSEAHRREVEAALEADPSLRALEQRLRRSIGAVESLSVSAEVTVSPSLRRAVLEAVSTPTWKERWLRWPVLLPASMAMAAGVAVLVFAPPRESVDEDRLFLAQNMEGLSELELMEDLDVVDVPAEADLEVVAALHELEAP